MSVPQVLDCPTGTTYFVTISLSVDYEPSDDVISQLSYKVFPDQCYAVIEKGENGKAHFHLVGTTSRRQDSLKRSLKSFVQKDGFEFDDKFSIDVLPEPNLRWRVGYLMKEPDRQVLINQGFAEATLEACRVEYERKPKRQRSEKRGKTLSIRQLAEQAIEQNCNSDDSIREFLKNAKYSGQLPYDVYQKLNVKKFRSYLLDLFDD